MILFYRFLSGGGWSIFSWNHPEKVEIFREIKLDAIVGANLTKLLIEI